MAIKASTISEEEEEDEEEESYANSFLTWFPTTTTTEQCRVRKTEWEIPKSSCVARRRFHFQSVSLYQLHSAQRMHALPLYMLFVLYVRYAAHLQPPDQTSSPLDYYVIYKSASQPPNSRALARNSAVPCRGSTTVLCVVSPLRKNPRDRVRRSQVKSSRVE